MILLLWCVHVKLSVRFSTRQFTHKAMLARPCHSHITWQALRSNIVAAHVQVAYACSRPTFNQHVTQQACDITKQGSTANLTQKPDTVTLFL